MHLFGCSAVYIRPLQVATTGEVGRSVSTFVLGSTGGQPAGVLSQSSAASALRFSSEVSPMRCQRSRVTQRKRARPGRCTNMSLRRRSGDAAHRALQLRPPRCRRPGAGRPRRQSAASCACAQSYGRQRRDCTGPRSRFVRTTSSFATRCATPMSLRHGLPVIMVPPLLPPNALTASSMSSYSSPYNTLMSDGPGPATTRRSPRLAPKFSPTGRAAVTRSSRVGQVPGSVDLGSLRNAWELAGGQFGHGDGAANCHHRGIARGDGQGGPGPKSRPGHEKLDFSTLPR